MQTHPNLTSSVLSTPLMLKRYPPPTTLASAVCDFNAAKAYAVPGTICYGAVCSGSIKKAPAEE